MDRLLDKKASWGLSARARAASKVRVSFETLAGVATLFGLSLRAELMARWKRNVSCLNRDTLFRRLLTAAV